MKILHTSDWHIGHQVSGIDRYDEYELFFEWLRKQIEKEKIDVLLISGDIFDIYNPSYLAEEQYFNFLASLSGKLRKVIIIGGNHDSPKTLEAPKEVLKSINVDIISGAKNNYKKIIDFEDFQILAVSYLRENILKEKNEDLLKAIEKIYDINANKPVIAMGHLSVYGASFGGGERDIYIGKIEAIPSNVFEKFSYTALGHIHKYQEIKDNIIYSGSPLQMAFDEDYDKKIVIIDTENWQKKLINVPRFRKFIKLKGNFETVYKKISEISEEYNKYMLNVEKKDLKPFIEIEFSDNVSSEDIESIKTSAENLYILKIKLPLNFSDVNNIDVKKISFEEIIRNLFEDEEDLDEIIKIITEIKTEIKEEK